MSTRLATVWTRTLLAALVAPESGFVPDIQSPAKAVGLMQLIPGTAQRYARKLAIASYAHAHLVRPETNVRLGTAYFADLMRELGDAHFRARKLHRR